MSRSRRARGATAAAGSGETHVYLSRPDVLDLMPSHGFQTPGQVSEYRRRASRRYLEWSWTELWSALTRAGVLCGGPVARHLPEDAIGVLISRAGDVILDDGSLVHPAREQSWARQDGRRLSEHCAFRGFAAWSPVIVHAPHTSLYIPASVRAELLLDDEGLRDELAAMTDAGVAEVLDHLDDLPAEARPAIVAATMSRLVFDPERFPAGDEMEAVGMGLVYTRRADGTPLRRELTPERLAWYRAQHRAYTESLERVVDAALERFGTAVILDLHSYPKDPLGYEDPSLPRPEVCVGTDAFHTPAWLLEEAESTLSDRFEAAVDSPFAGAYVPGRFYRTDPRVHSVMLEFRRDVLKHPGNLTAAVDSIRDVVRAALEHATSRSEVRRA